jgi:meso-butanediol dehydrogenase/(S,S)-butanediol dehydrogenase/diacetyl reductase
LSVDVTEAASVEAAVAAHVRHFGGLDVMVANAGIAVTALLSSGNSPWMSMSRVCCTATSRPRGR